MGVTLTHATADDLDLPFPAHNQAVELESNQTMHRSAGGTLYTVKHGPTRWRVTRVFEALTDSEMRRFRTFFRESGEVGGDIGYAYTPHGGSEASTACQIVEKPSIQLVHRDNWNLTLVFEQDGMPRDEAAVEEFELVGGPFEMMDGDALLLIG